MPCYRSAFLPPAIFLLVIALSAKFEVALSQYPVLYPSPRETIAVVEDEDSSILYSGHSAFGLFVCYHENDTLTIPCDKNLRVWTSNETIRVVLSWINETQSFAPHPGDALIEVYTSDNRRLATPIEKTPYHGIVWHLEVAIKYNIPRPIEIRATLQRKTTRLLVYQDFRPPIITIAGALREHENDDGSVHALFSVQAENDRVLLAMDNGACTCVLGEGDDIEGYTYTVEDLVERYQRCHPVKRDSEIINAVQVDGGEITERVTSGSIGYIQANVIPAQSANIRATIKSNRICDLAGNLNTNTTRLTLYYRPTIGVPMKDRRERLMWRDVQLKRSKKNSLTGLVVGQVTNAAVAGSLASSTVSGGASPGSIQRIPFFLLSILQKLYLSSNVAVNDMPEVYTDFAAQLTWVMFDFPSPFERFVNTENKSIVFEADDEEDLNDEADTYWSNINGAYLYFARVFFWVPLLFFCLLLVHFCVLFACFWRRTRVPYIFTFPRLEIMFCYWGMPAIATACAGLLRGDRKDALIAVWLLVLLPGSMIVWNVSTLWSFFYSKNLREQKAHFVVESEAVREKTLVKLQKEWKRMKSLRSHETRDPPVLFTNGFFDYDDPLSQRSQHQPETELRNESPEPFLSYTHTERGFSEANISEELLEAMERGFEEEKALLNDEQSQSPSTSVPVGSTSPPSATASSSLDLSDGGGMSQRPLSAQRRLALSHPLEIPNSDNMSRAGPSPKMPSPASSGNNLYTSTDEVYRSPRRQINSMTELNTRGSNNMQENRMMGLKFSVSERFRLETSNNPTAFLVLKNPLAFDAEQDRMLQSTTCSPRPSETEDEILGEETSPPLPSFHESVPIRQRSLDNSFHIPDEFRQSKKTQRQNPEWAAVEVKCTAVPAPAWKSILCNPAEYSPPRQQQNVTPAAFPQRRRRGRSGEPAPALSRISEDTHGTKTSSPFGTLPPASSSLSTPQDLVGNSCSAPRSAGMFRGTRPFDSQLGISYLEPAPFTETAARLKHINNECLMDLGLDHLIPAETTGSEEDEAEFEDLRISRLATIGKRRSISTWIICKDLCDMGICSVIMGRHQPSGRWRVSPRCSKFIYKYGYLFEDFRGPPVLLRKPTFDLKPGCRLDRGKIFPLSPRPLFSWRGFQIFNGFVHIPGFVLYKHHIQLMTRFLQMIKVMLLGVSIAGVGTSKESIAQLLFLLLGCTLLLTALRIAHPYLSRTEMTVSLSEEAADSVFLSLAVLFVIGPGEDDEFRTRIGTGMITVECISLIAIVGHQLIISCRGVSRAQQRKKERQMSEVARVVRKYLSKNAYFIKRKYFDRWMVHALGRGLYNRVPARYELRRLKYIKQQFRSFSDSYSMLRNECLSIWTDFRKAISVLSSAVYNYVTFSKASGSERRSY